MCKSRGLCTDGRYFAQLEFLETQKKVSLVKYPFLKSYPQYDIAKKQMKQGGNIVAFEIKGGIEAGPPLPRESLLVVS